MECSIDGCNKPVKARGMCWAHYQAQRRYGSPDGKPRATHCNHGHEYSDANTYVRSDGRRMCKACMRRRNREQRARERQAERDWHAANGTTHYRHSAAD